MAEIIEMFTFSELEKRLNKAEKFGPSFKRWDSRLSHLDDGDTTWSWAETMDKFVNGWDAPVNEMNAIAAITSINKIGNMTARKTELSYCGYAPNVAAMLTGQPRTMWRKVTTKRLDRTLNFKALYMANYWSDISQTTIKQAGQILFMALRGFEKRGSNIILEAGVNIEKEGRNRWDSSAAEHFKFRLKSQGGFIPLRMWAMPIMAPEFLRRIVIHVIETCTDLKNNWASGYGHPTFFSPQSFIEKSAEQVAKRLKAAKEKYMQTNSFMTATDVVIEFSFIRSIMNSVYAMDKRRGRSESTALTPEQMKKAVEILMTAMADTINS